jgi:hypothetical protein
MLSHRKGFPKRALTARIFGEGDSMPDTIKFLLVVGCLAGAVYGSAWALSHFPPEQAEVVKPLSAEKLRQK